MIHETGRKDSTNIPISLCGGAERLGFTAPVGLAINKQNQKHNTVFTF